MAEEKSPYQEEEDTQRKIEEAIIAILALALVSSVQDLDEDFSPQDLEGSLDTYLNKSSEVIPILSSFIPTAIKLGIDRFKELSSYSINMADSTFTTIASEIFNENFSYIQSVNREALALLQSERLTRNWSNKEFIRRVKTYFGLTSTQISQILAYEDSLVSQIKPKLDKDTIKARIQTKVDRLLNWRLKLISTRLSVSLVEESKLASWIYLEDSYQLELGSYGKQWVSVIDDVTTETCINTNMEIVPLRSPFSNGVYTPPAINPLHPCRSSIRLVKL